MNPEADPAHLHQARRGLFELYRAGGRLTWVQAQGTSMRPTIRADAWMHVQFGALPRRAGDVIVFTKGQSTIAHRVIAIDGDVLLVKGDGSLRFDAPVALADVLGVVRAVRRTPAARPRTFGCSGAGASGAAVLSALAGRIAGRLRAGARAGPDS